ncbi:hypothetical protein HYY75_04105 [bacterium]|nr:hypothetical protein [bacterium]
MAFSPEEIKTEPGASSRNEHPGSFSRAILVYGTNDAEPAVNTFMRLWGKDIGERFYASVYSDIASGIPNATESIWIFLGTPDNNSMLASLSQDLAWPEIKVVKGKVTWRGRTWTGPGCAVFATFNFKGRRVILLGPSDKAAWQAFLGEPLGEYDIKISIKRDVVFEGFIKPSRGVQIWEGGFTGWRIPGTPAILR